jgi:hypothetical protein
VVSELTGCTVFAAARADDEGKRRRVDVVGLSGIRQQDEWVPEPRKEHPIAVHSTGVAGSLSLTASVSPRPVPMKCCGHERGEHRAILPQWFRLCRAIVDGQPCLCRKLAF